MIMNCAELVKDRLAWLMRINPTSHRPSDDDLFEEPIS
jgi:hypothetical protein